MPKSVQRPPIRREGERPADYSYGYGYTGHRRDQRPRKLNVRLALISFCVVAIGVPSVYFWHGYQMKRLSASLWEYGQKMAAEENWREASSAYYRVWEIQQDPKLLGDAVTAYDKLAAKSDPKGLIAAYQRAIGGLPERTDLRVRLAELLLLQKQYNAARKQSKKVLSEKPNELHAQKYLALSYLGLYRTNQPVPDVDVLEELKRAFLDQQFDFDLATALVSHIRDDLRAQNDSELAIQADGVMNRLVASQPSNVQARLLRYQYRLKHSLKGATEDIDLAVRLAPQSPLVLREAARGALQSATESLDHSEYLSARQLFKELIELQPQRAEGYLGLGDVEFLVAGDVDAAVNAWNRGRESVGDSLAFSLRIAEGLSKTRRFEALETTLEDLEKLIRSKASLNEVDRNWARAATGLFRGRMLMAQDRFEEAIAPLTQATDLADSLPKSQVVSNVKSIVFSAFSSLGTSYRQLGRAKDAADALERALKVFPESEPTLLASADAWFRIGDVGRALKQVRRAKRLANPTAQVFLLEAQYMLEETLRLPPEDRDWQRVEVSLKLARQQLPDSWQLRLLEVDYLVHQQSAELRDVSLVASKLHTMEQDFPQTVQVWQRLPFIYESLGLASNADRALNRLEQLTNSSLATKLHTVDMLLWRGDDQAARRVWEQIPKSSLSQGELHRCRMSELRILRFEADQAKMDEALVTMRSELPNDPYAVEQLLERRWNGLSKLRVPNTPELIEDLKTRQPESQATWQYYLASQELDKESPDLGKVQNHLVSLVNRLPHWSRTQELAGRFAWVQENFREARQAFEVAAGKPNPSPQLIHRLVDEYTSNRDYLSLFRLFERQHRLPMFSQPWDAGDSLLQAKLQSMELEALLKQDAANSIWHALLDEAELADESLATSKVDGLMLKLWKSRHAKSTDSQSDLAELASLEFPSESVKRFVLGQAYQLAGDYQLAKQEYRQVTESLMRLKAELYAGLASAHLNRDELQQHEIEQRQQRAQLRLQAIVNLRRGGQQDLKAAKSLLLSLTNRSEAETGDHMLLASCFEQLGDFDSSLAQWELVVEQDATAYHLSLLIDALLRHGKYDKAEVWIDQLEEQTGWQRKTVLLRSRWMVATNRLNEIRPFVEMYAAERFKRAPSNTTQAMREISEIYRQVGLLDDAKRWLEALAKNNPSEAEPLSRLLVDNNEMDRAIQRCIDQLAQQPDVETATLLARILVYGEATPATFESVLPVLGKCETDFADDASFLFALGNVYIRRGEYSRGIDLLSRVTEIQPGHYLAWNNLAALLAETEGREAEAMKTIDEAIQQAAYEIPTLLDTKAVVLLHQDQLEAAVKLLQENVTPSRAASDPRFYFHLAMCLERLGNKDGARVALEESLELGLKGSFLTKFEGQELERMASQFQLEQL